MWTVKLGHKDKFARYRFFVVPGDGPVMISMPGIDLPGLLKITCEVVGCQQRDRKFNSQTIQLSNSHSYKANIDQEIKSDKADKVDAN